MKGSMTTSLLLVLLGLGILWLAVTGRLPLLKRAWDLVTGSPDAVFPTNAPGGSLPTVGQQAQAITMVPLPYGPALSMS
jgi:hypothetical protein